MRKKRLLLLGFCVVLAVPTFAQQEEDVMELRPLNMDSIQLEPQSAGASKLFGNAQPTGLSVYDTPTGYRPVTVPCYHPCGMPFLCDQWNLHQGLNVSMQTGVSVGFGRNNPFSGAAFFTNITGIYAQPINDRLTVAAGLSYGRYDGWGTAQNRVGIMAMANYRLTDRLDLTGYVTHSFGVGQQSRLGMAPYVPGLQGNTTTVGADLGIKTKNGGKVSVGISFEKHDEPQFAPVKNMPTPQTGRR